jgi:tellurite methyltransferase
MADEDREKWDQRYASGEHVRSQAPGWLRDLDDELPVEGRALDVAAGTGRVSVWLARRGLDVTAIDVSPIGLALAREAAADEGVKIKTVVADLERDPLPEGPFDLVACFHYRQQGLWPSIKNSLRTGGMVIAELPTLRTLERSQKPSKRWLAEPNELLRDLAGLSVVYYRERWASDRHVARLAARKEPT